MRTIKRILTFLLVILLFVGGVTYAFTPSEKIENSQRLENANETISLNDLYGDFFNNASYNNGKVSTTIKLSNSEFKGLLNQITRNDPKLQEGSYEFEGDKVVAKLPIKVGFWETQLESEVYITVVNNKLTLTLENAKIGKVGVPNIILENYLKEALSNTEAVVNDNVITLDLASNISIDKGELKSNQLELTLSISQSQMVNLGASALRSALVGN